MADSLEIMGIPVHARTLICSRERVLSFLEERGKSRAVFSINPEIIMASRQDRELRELLHQGSFNLPDGIGIVWGGRWLGYRIPERVTGCDLIREIMPFCARRGFRIFLLGGEPGVAAAAALNLKQEFPALNIVGTQHGFFTGEEEDNIREKLGEARPDLLVVGMGFPRQEQFIRDNAIPLGIPVSIAVGGTLEVLAGRKKRAPRLLQRIGLEWFYRIVSLGRWDRFLSLLSFCFLIIREKLRGGTAGA